MRGPVATLENIVRLWIRLALRNTLYYSNHVFYGPNKHSPFSEHGLFMPYSSCHFPSNTKYSDLIFDASVFQPGFRATLGVPRVAVRGFPETDRSSLWRN